MFCHACHATIPSHSLDLPQPQSSFSARSQSPSFPLTISSYHTPINSITLSPPIAPSPHTLTVYLSYTIHPLYTQKAHKTLSHITNPKKTITSHDQKRPTSSSKDHYRTISRRRSISSPSYPLPRHFSFLFFLHNSTPYNPEYFISDPRSALPRLASPWLSITSSQTKNQELGIHCLQDLGEF